jgi:Cdc6-like AAA superfamily ATPase
VFTLTGDVGHERGALVVFPPYGAEEVAEAVRRRLEHGGFRVRRLVVTADDVARNWCVEARLEEWGDVVAGFPFSSPAGIHTPGELADWFAAAAKR